MKLKSSKGFTLIEMLIVIAIIAILTAITIPTFSHYNNNRNLKEAAQEISGDIQLYKQRAVAENTRYRIVFAVGGNNYSVQKETFYNSNVWVDVVVNKAVSPDNNQITLIGADSTVPFSNRGITTSGANVTQVIQHSKLLSQATIITSTMGKVSVTYVLN